MSDQGIRPQLLKRFKQLNLPKNAIVAFVSHHKADAGEYARFLHDEFCRILAVHSAAVFLDSNDLHNLSSLLDNIKQSQVVLLLQTKDVLARPYVLAELYTALQNSIPIVAISIQGKGYSFEETNRFLSSGEFAKDLDAKNPGSVRALQAMNIDVAYLGTVLQSRIPEIISKPLNMHASDLVLAAMVDDILQQVIRQLEQKYRIDGSSLAVFSGGSDKNDPESLKKHKNDSDKLIVLDDSPAKWYRRRGVVLLLFLLLLLVVGGSVGIAAAVTQGFSFESGKNFAPTSPPTFTPTQSPVFPTLSLLGSEATGEFTEQGTTIALQASLATYAFIGAPKDNFEIGTIWAFNRSSTTQPWTQVPGGKLNAVGTTGSSVNLGSCLAIDQNASVLVSGGPSNDGSKGGVWTWHRNPASGGWSQISSLFAPGPTSSRRFGASVALDDEGVRLLVGAPSDTLSGAVYVFDRGNQTAPWNFITKLTAINLNSAFANFGTAIGLSADGKTAVIGASGETPNGGASFIFVRNDSDSQWYNIQKLENVCAGSCIQGSAVAISGDASVIAIGGPTDNSFRGRVWVWVKVARDIYIPRTDVILLSPTFQVQFGTSVALSRDGKRLVVGAPGALGGGCAFVYQTQNITASNWNLVLSNVQPRLSNTADQFGTSVAITHSGDHILVGGPHANSRLGETFSYAINF